MILLRNASIYAPESLGLCHILVGGERILWIGPNLDALPPALDVAEVDLEGRVVVPGLIDGHAHLTGGGGEAGPETRVPAPLLSSYTRVGVTTAIGVLGTDDVVRSTADLVATARGLVADGLSAWCHTGGYHLPPTTLTGSVRGDITHIDCIIGVGEIAISDHRSSQPSLQELLRVASEAHLGGLLTGKAGILHLHVGDGPRGLELIRQALEVSELPPRVFNPTHVNRRRALFDEAVALAKHGCWVDITAFDVRPDEDAWSAVDAIEHYWDHGAPPERVTVSSDAGGCLPDFDDSGRVIRMGVGDAGSLWLTLQALHRRGHALERILPVFTSNVAALLRLPRKGRISPGFDADLVVLGEDATVYDVMARGTWHVRDGKRVRLGMFERPDGTPALS